MRPTNRVDSIDLTKCVEPAIPLEGYEGQIRDLTWSPDGRWLVAAATDGALYQWDVNRRYLQKKINKLSLTRVAWSPQGDQIACATEKGQLHFFTALPLRERHVEPISGDPLLCLAWTPSGRQLACAGVDTRVYIKQMSRVPGIVDLQVGVGHKSPVRCLAWSPDASAIVSGTEAGNIGVWEDSRVDNELRHCLPGPQRWSHSGTVVDLAWSEASLASASADGSFRFWDVTRRKTIGDFQCPEPATGVAFSADGRVLIARTSGKFISFARTNRTLFCPSIAP